MIEDRLDLAMRVGEITDTSLVARRSGTTVRVAAATPSYTSGTATRPAPPNSQTTYALCTTSDQIRTSGPLLRRWTTS